MARPRTTFTDDELRGILDAATQAHTRSPDHNAAFLDDFITGVAHATGRLYGQPTYVRLLDAAGITRRPSAPTWSAAIARVRARLPSPAQQTALPPPIVQPQQGQMAERLALPPGRADERTSETAEWKVRTQVAEASLSDAYRQIRRIETQRDEALRRLAIADARAAENERRLREVTAEKDAVAATLTERVDALKAAEGRLAGLERHLRLQTDQLRTELSQQVSHYKSRLESAEKALDRERGQTDALRRVLGNRGAQSADDSGRQAT